MNKVFRLKIEKYCNIKKIIVMKRKFGYNKGY